MIHFRSLAVQALLAERKPHIALHTFQYLSKVIERGAKDIDPYTLSHLCRDLGCLPNDIVEFD